MTVLHIDLAVELTSDWHIGSGEGRHRSVDALIERDHEELPYARSGTLRGMLRAGLQTLAHGLDDGKPGAWTALVAALLGSEPALTPECETAPAESRLRLSDARLAPALRAVLAGAEAGKAALREALVFVKPGVSIDPWSGRAKTDSLRFEEAARVGTILHATGSLELPDGMDAETVAAFLIGGAAFVERLGGKRHRGMGKCQWTLTFRDTPGGVIDGGAAWAADILGKAIEAPSLRAVQSGETQARTFSGAVNENAWEKIPLRIALRSPLLVAGEVQGNVMTSLDFIPGGYLLPPIANRLKANGFDPWPHVIAGDIRVLPATPEIAGKRGLPLPFCWERPKGEKGFEGVRPTPREPNPDVQHTPFRGGFVTGEGTPSHGLLSVNRVLRTHNTIQDDIQRPDESIGGLYSYEALAPGQVFRSEVWVRTDLAAKAGGKDALARGLAGPERLGRAQSAGYGEADITIADAPAAFGKQDRKEAPGVLRVWLLSDALPPPHAAAMGGLEALANMIAAALGGKAEALFDLENEKSWGSLRPRRVDGWQRQWGLPRPTLAAIAAGSVAELVLKPGQDIDIDRLEREGIGARKGEGFGCLVANHRYLDAAPGVTKPDAAKEASSLGAPELTDKEKTYLKSIHYAAWKRCIDKRAEAAVAKAEDRQTMPGWNVSEPNMTQLGALRAAMGSSARGGLQGVLDWLAAVENIQKRKDKWPEKARGILRKLAGEAPPIWAYLKLQDGPEKDANFAGAPIPSRDWAGFDPLSDGELRQYAVRALLLHAMRFHKRKLEEEEQR